jgi:DNA-binding beta-propeller fold protein YncE
MAFGPDGQTLASSSDDQTVKLWNPTTGALLRTLSSDQQALFSVTLGFLRILRQNLVCSVAFSPDGQTLASSSADRKVKLWNPATGALLRTLSSNQDLVFSVAFSPDGRTLASASFADKTVKLWNSATGTLLRTLAGHQNSVKSVAFSPDGQTLASASDDKTVKLWNPATGALLRTLAGHQNYVVSVAFSPDGQTLASASADKTVKLWSPATGALLRTLAGHQNDVVSVAFSPDGRTMASASADSSFRMWRVSDGEPESATVLLPGTEWMTFLPRNLYYTGSQQVGDYAAIRFDSALRGLYPLSRPRYANLRVPDIRMRLDDPPPDLKPDLLYDAQTGLAEHRGMLGVFGLVYLISVAFTLVLHRRSDPSAVARRFFAGAGLKISAPGAGILQLVSTAKATAAFAFLWDSTWRARSEAVRQYRPEDGSRFKLYLIYRGQPPASEDWTSLRDSLNCDVIPLESNVLERAVSEGNCAERLRDMEEPFVVLSDPYNRTEAVTEATLFFGRQEVIDEIPKVLRQGQHMAILGLRRIGKTSVIKQVENRLLTVPFASFEILSHDTANRLFTRVLQELCNKMRTMHLKKAPSVTAVESDSDFRDQFLKLYSCWEAGGSREPFVLILDEAERLFLPREVAANEPDLTETARFFRVLRALAQERRCLVILAAAYRPNLNRWNKLGERAGENALFQQYREVFLAPLDAGSTHAMLTKLGLLREIRWTSEALEAAYHYSGGHPQLARFFASDVSRQGALKSIDAARVHETADEIRRDFRKHRIAALLREAIWLELRPEEQRVLAALSQGATPQAGDLNTLTDLDLLGVVSKNGDGYGVGARLLLDWLRANVA